MSFFTGFSLKISYFQILLFDIRITLVSKLERMLKNSVILFINMIFPGYIL